MVPIVQMLRQNQSHAEKIARQGRHLASRELAFDRTLAYFRTLLSSYSTIQRQSAADAFALSTEGYTRVRSAADLGRLTGQCECGHGVTKVDPGTCGVDPETFRRTASKGRYRCCDGWDCPREVCERR
mmetsp:Transcript_8298/g.21778  ORF Transcript_8298/g.21778 Transcript_8298/m.21778 type:complete len:128 (+) Transcript_8298:3-386(+)